MDHESDVEQEASAEVLLILELRRALLSSGDKRLSVSDRAVAKLRDETFYAPVISADTVPQLLLYKEVRDALDEIRLSSFDTSTVISGVIRKLEAQVGVAEKLKASMPNVPNLAEILEWGRDNKSATDAGPLATALDKLFVALRSATAAKAGIKSQSPKFQDSILKLESLRVGSRDAVEANTKQLLDLLASDLPIEMLIPACSLQIQERQLHKVAQMILELDAATECEAATKSIEEVANDPDREKFRIPLKENALKSVEYEQKIGKQFNEMLSGQLTVLQDMIHLPVRHIRATKEPHVVRERRDEISKIVMMQRKITERLVQNPEGWIGQFFELELNMLTTMAQDPEIFGSNAPSTADFLEQAARPAGFVLNKTLGSRRLRQIVSLQKNATELLAQDPEGGLRRFFEVEIKILQSCV